MTAPRLSVVGPRRRSAPLVLLLLTVATCLIRSNDQPGVTIGFGGSSATIVPGDVLLLVLLVLTLAELSRAGLPRSTWHVVGAAGVFCALILVTAARNDATAFISAVKLDELAVLALAAVAFVRAKAHVEEIVSVVIAVTVAADAYGVVKFIADGGGRQGSFLGEHDFAAVATLPLVYGLAVIFERRPGPKAWLAVAAGGIGCVLGSALASLVGLYLALLVLVPIAVARGQATRRALATAAVVVAAVTGGTLGLRAGELGFLQSWFGSPPSRPGQYAGSWSQRLIYAYVGGRIFLGKPVLGTGWYGNLPPKEFVAYLPDARRRFSDQPANYFPPPDRPFVPQQAWDEIVYELGLVGAASMLALLVALGVVARRAARLFRDRFATLPAVLVAASVGALAGDGLFGGTPLAATVWLTIGLAAAIPLVEERGT